MLFLERSNPVNWWYVLHLHFLRLWRNFFSSIHLVYLSEKEDIIDPEHISKTRKIDQTLKIHKLERKCRQNGDTDIFFSKFPMLKILFTCSGMVARMKSFAAILKPVKVMTNERNAREVIMKMKSGYVVLYIINGKKQSSTGVL